MKELSTEAPRCEDKNDRSSCIDNDVHLPNLQKKRIKYFRTFDVTIKRIELMALKNNTCKDETISIS